MQIDKYWQNLKLVLFNKTTLISTIIAALLTVCGYFSNNWGLFTGENLALFTYMEWHKRICSDNCDDYPGALFVNTSFDKELIPIYDNKLEIGNTEITDRRKLLDFLKLLSQTDYAYTIIDLRFAEGLSHKDSVGKQVDAELFDFIKSMRNCVIATHRNIKLIDDLNSKAALADYKSTVTSTNFIRYEYFDSIPSIPLHVYNELHKSVAQDTINYSKRIFGLPYFTDGKRLCQNSLFLEFSSKSLSQNKKIPTEFYGSSYIQSNIYKNLGSDFVDYIGCHPDSMIVNMIDGNLKQQGNGDSNNTIVYIGNFLEDLHDTYAGLQPGMVILYKAIHALQEGRHIVDPIRFVLQFLFYFILCLFVLMDIGLMNLFSAKFLSHHQFLVFILQLVSISTFLFLAAIIDITVFHITTNFIFATLMFGLLKLYVRFKNRTL